MNKIIILILICVRRRLWQRHRWQLLLPLPDAIRLTARIRTRRNSPTITADKKKTENFCHRLCRRPPRLSNSISNLFYHLFSAFHFVVRFASRSIWMRKALDSSAAFVRWYFNFVNFISSYHFTGSPVTSRRFSILFFFSIHFFFRFEFLIYWF